MNFAGKIRAGRAYLNWKQEDVANRANLSLQGVQKVERGDTAPTARTQGKIIRAFEKHGIIFTDKGIEFVENPIFFVEGKTHEETYLQLLEDVSEHSDELKNPELLIMFSDDQVSPPSVNNKYKELRDKGVKMRQLIKEGNKYIIAPLEEYRYVPKEFFINRVTLIYGDRIANETSNVLRASIKIDPINSEIQRNTFNMLWSMLEQPTESTSDERF